MATCSRMAINGINPIAGPSSPQMSPKLRYTVPLELVVRFREKGGRAKLGRPALMLPRIDSIEINWLFYFHFVYDNLPVSEKGL